MKGLVFSLGGLGLAWSCAGGRMKAPSDAEEGIVPRVLVTGYLPEYRLVDFAPAT